MKRMVLFCLVVLLIQSVASAAEKKIRVGINPVWTLLGITRVQGEYRYQPDIAPGLDYFAWNIDVGDGNFSMTGIHPYARWYKEPEASGLYAGAGYMMINFSYSSNTSSGSASVSGLTGEGGYQWRWENFHQELGYELWMLGDMETDDGDSFNMGSVAGVAYSLGWYF